MDSLNLEHILSSDYSSDYNLYYNMPNRGKLLLAMEDSDNKIHSIFKIKDPMRPAVYFWLKIYTEYSTKHSVIYDRFHPELVYEVLDFRPLFKKSKSLMGYEIARENQVKRRLSEYKSAFIKIEKAKKKNKKITASSYAKSSLEHKILSVIESSDHYGEHTIKQFHKNLRLQTGQRDNVIKGLLAAEVFFPKMEEIFKQLDIPHELTRISLVESSFNLNAHSKAGARGVWQFMPASGKEYLLIDENHGIDERVSPMKSTVAAARLLKRNLSMTGNWPLAITAYNHGFTGIKKLSAKQRNLALTGELFELCQKKKYLGYASSNYYAEFLALLHAEAYREQFYGENPLPNSPPLKFHRINQPTTPLRYSKAHGLTLEEFRLYNPDVRKVQQPLPVGFYAAIPGKEAEIDELISAIRVKHRMKTKRSAVALRSSSRRR